MNTSHSDYKILAVLSHFHSIEMWQFSTREKEIVDNAPLIRQSLVPLFSKQSQSWRHAPVDVFTWSVTFKAGGEGNCSFWLTYRCSRNLAIAFGDGSSHMKKLPVDVLIESSRWSPLVLGLDISVLSDTTTTPSKPIKAVWDKGQLFLESPCQPTGLWETQIWKMVF